MSRANYASDQTVWEAEPGAVRRAGEWMRDGWRLFCRAPTRLYAFLFAMLLVEVLIQLTVPAVGMVLSKWLMAIMGGVFWVSLAQLERHGKLQPLQAVAACRGRMGALMALATISLVAFGTQIGVAWVLAGTPAVEMLLFAVRVPIDSWTLALILAAGVPISTLLMFAAPRVLLNRETLAQALIGGPRAVLQYVGPMSILMLLTWLIVVLAPVTFLLSALLAGPWLICVSYAAFRDIGQANSEQMAPSR